ncbi:hematopoietically-expressed homeobox protein HHEX-like [Chrysoperla carnea]|uniref:hematopoietically-expressed homeobox protein HHEX-like n=1 Tax=Chrysoperla carnea TaxID=189513 RepID=UPI001D068F9D|nr:hematopoietically-expressed homeobox protein HHEX-like [Chrysoperla carnea]
MKINKNDTLPIIPKACYYKRNFFDPIKYATTASQINYFHPILNQQYPYHFYDNGLYFNNDNTPRRDYSNNNLSTNITHYFNRSLPNPLECSRYFKPYKRKGGQVRFTPFQTEALEKKFSSNKYLSPDDRKEIADLLVLSDRQVKTWFQNRRAKWRRTTTTQETIEDHSITSSNHNDDNFVIEIQ